MATLGTYLQLPVVDLAAAATENALAIPTGAVVVRLLPTDTTCTINGIAGAEDGRVLILYLPPNASGSSISLAHENAGATAAQRINTVGGGTKTLVKTAGAGFCARMLVYDGGQSRWIAMG